MASQGGRIINRLFVGNIPWTIGHRELFQYFSQFGHLSSAKVIFDRNTGFSKGYGFIEFASKDAYDAVTNKRDHVLEGNSVVLQPASV